MTFFEIVAANITLKEVFLLVVFIYAIGGVFYVEFWKED